MNKKTIAALAAAALIGFAGTAFAQTAPSPAVDDDTTVTDEEDTDMTDNADDDTGGEAGVGGSGLDDDDDTGAPRTGLGGAAE